MIFWDCNKHFFLIPLRKKYAGISAKNSAEISADFFAGIFTEISRQKFLQKFLPKKFFFNFKALKFNIYSTWKSESECSSQVEVCSSEKVRWHGIFKQHKKSAESSAEFFAEFFAEIPAHFIVRVLKNNIYYNIKI